MKGSAKDLAFERERIKFRQQIKKLECDLLSEKIRSNQLETQLKQQEEKYNSLFEYFNKLLTFSNLTEEEIKTAIEKDRQQLKTMETVNGLFSFFKNSGYSFYSGN